MPLVTKWDSIMSDFYNFFFECFKDNVDFIGLINELIKENRVFVIGGFVRDYLYGHPYNFRDVDVVVDTDNALLEQTIFKNIPKSKIVKNRFNGYKLILKNLTVDIWSIKETWAIKNGYFKENELLDTVYLNVDAYAFDLSNKCYYDNCDKRIQPKEIDLCFDINPNEELNLARSFVLSKKYSLNLSDNIKKKILNLMKDKDKLQRFLSSQIDHYGKIEIDLNELNHIAAQWGDIYA